MDKKRVVKDFFVYSVGNYISQALGMVAGFLTRAFLDPYAMGIWQGLSIIKSYASYTNLGVTKSAARDIAYFRGKKQTDSVETIKNVSASFTLATIVVVAGGLLVYAMAVRSRLHPYVFWGIIAMGGIVVLERSESLIVTMLRAHTRFSVESLAKVVTAFLNVGLIFLIVRPFRLYGFYCVHAFIFAVSIGLLLKFSGMRFTWAYDRQQLARLIKVGLPLVTFGFMFTNLINIDRIIILKMLGAKQLGLYSIAFMVGNALYGISNMAGVVLYPRFQEKYGGSDDKKELYRMMKSILSLLAIPLLVLIVGALAIAPFLVRKFLPHYAEGIGAMKIFVCGIYFLSLAIFCGHYLITIDRQMYALIACVGSIVCNVVLNIVFITMGFGIRGVALATSSAYVVYFVVLRVMAARSVRV